MKPAPYKQFEDASPLVDYRYYLPEHQPLLVRFAKAVIGSKYAFRAAVGMGLLSGAAMYAEQVVGGHNFETHAECEVVYYQNTSWWWEDQQYKRMVARADTENNGSMINTFEACRDMLDAMDGDDTIFVGYTSSTHASHSDPAMNFIDGTASFGLNGAQVVEDTPDKRLAEAIGIVEHQQRWLFGDYMRAVGRTYTFENFEYQFDQKYYEASDAVEYKIDDIIYDTQVWYNEKRQAFSNKMDRFWAQLNPF